MSEDDEVGRLLRAAGRRNEPSPETLQRMHRHVHAQWQATHAPRRWHRGLAIAASILVVSVAAGALYVATIGVAPGPQIARVEGRPSSLRIERDALAWRSADDASLIETGDRVTTGSTGALLARLPSGGATLRMDRDTTLQWRDDNRVRLLRGRVYVDTGGAATRGPADAGSPLVIEAADVLIEHVGTQYVTAISAGSVSVAVREGLVQVAIGRERTQLARGEAATIATTPPGQATIRRDRVQTSGDGWRWADQLAPRLPLEGRTLAAVLMPAPPRPKPQRPCCMDRRSTCRPAMRCAPYCRRPRCGRSQLPRAPATSWESTCADEGTIAA
jgi:ferric-dicitrate binding protein FerR (iron transport regulator)